ncbi:hypothetical protein BDW66DRAFT_90960 [Aspergillus desertorum]
MATRPTSGEDSLFLQRSPRTIVIILTLTTTSPSLTSLIGPANPPTAPSMRLSRRESSKVYIISLADFSRADSPLVTLGQRGNDYEVLADLLQPRNVSVVRVLLLEQPVLSSSISCAASKSTDSAHLQPVWNSR